MIVLEGLEEKEALERLQESPNPKAKEELPLPPTNRLGYRGLLVEHLGKAKNRLPSKLRVIGGNGVDANRTIRLSDPGFEHFICGASGPIRRLHLSAKVVEGIHVELENLHVQPMPRKSKLGKPSKACQCAPLYEPAWWNDGGQRQANNNCYNYAANYRTDTFAQPGLAAGTMYGAFTGADVSAAALADDLESTSLDNVCPEQGHLVALVIAPGVDFHWYRKGSDGLWTHKPGGMATTNLDNSNQIITDPRTADRGMYTDFRQFMVVKHGHIKLR
ncbi:MAG: hypothetical protein SFU86_19165 [Pirellulaceae bacterium]|nr:hypothetical protein [Pirellulaceae bacterium]